MRWLEDLDQGEVRLEDLDQGEVRLEDPFASLGFNSPGLDFRKLAN